MPKAQVPDGIANEQVIEYLLNLIHISPIRDGSGRYGVMGRGTINIRTDQIAKFIYDYKSGIDGKRKEKEELEELARLKAKYPNANNS